MSEHLSAPALRREQTRIARADRHLRLFTRTVASIAAAALAVIVVLLAATIWHR